MIVWMFPIKSGRFNWNQTWQIIARAVIKIRYHLFAKILIEKNIFNHLKEVKETFDQLVDQEQNILDGFIYTPFELSETQISKIQAAFENKFNAKCNFKIVIDKDLIAGIRVLINETIFEYSVESKLDNIKENLNQYYDNYFKNNKEGK